MLATAKHFVGDGGTTYGSSTTGSYTIDQGVTTRDAGRAERPAPRRRSKTAVQPHGVGSVMPSYSSLQIIGQDGADQDARTRRLITGVLKSSSASTGFVISDWEGIDQIGPDYETDIKTAVNAGHRHGDGAGQVRQLRRNDLTDLVNTGLTSPRRGSTTRSRGS